MIGNDVSDCIYIDGGFMRIRISVFVILILALVSTSCQFPTQNTSKEATAPSSDSQSSMDKYLEWRELWFSIKPDEIGLDLDPSSTIPFAVVMDIGLDAGKAASFASSIVGDGSFLTSTGGGILGSGQQFEDVRDASIQFVEMSADFIDKMESATEYPLPAADNIKFYVITPSGIYTAPEADWDTLGSGNHELSPLFFMGNNVITAIREASGQ
jgi:hypothetical protein